MLAHSRFPLPPIGSFTLMKNSVWALAALPPSDCWLWRESVEQRLPLPLDSTTNLPMKKNLIETSIATLRLQREHYLSSTQMELLMLIAYFLTAKGTCTSSDLYGELPLHVTTIRNSLDNLAVGEWITTSVESKLKTSDSGGSRVIAIEHTAKLVRLIQALKAAVVPRPAQN